MAQLVLNKPSGGQLTLAPEDGTSSETIIIPASGFPANPKVSSILLTTSTTFSFTDDANTSVPNMALTMTSNRSSIKHLVHVRIFGEPSVNDHDFLAGLYVNGVDVNGNTDAVTQAVRGLTISTSGHAQGNHDSTPVLLEFTTLVSSNTAGSIVFQPYVKSVSGSGTFYLNRSVNASTGGAYERGSSEIIVQEILP